MSTNNARKCTACDEVWPTGFLEPLTEAFGELEGTCPACRGALWKASVPPGSREEQATEPVALSR